MFSIISLLLFSQYFTVYGYYQVIGPKIIRPQSEYHAAVSIMEAQGPTQVRMIIEGVSYNGSMLNIVDKKNVLPYSSELFSFKVPFIPPGAYRLQVQGTSGVDFLSYFPLSYIEKSFSILIETDKVIYNPGSVVNFRIVILDSQLKPVGNVPSEEITVQVSDNDQNKIMVWRNISLPRGVYSDNFKLSSKPVLGSWNITVHIMGQSSFKTIQVAKYILPGFRIDIESKDHISFQDGVIIANIRSYYHHGEKLEGEVTVNAFPTIFSNVIQPIFQNPIRKVMPIDGSAIVEFDIVKDLHLNDEYERTVILDVAVEEKLTGRRENSSIKIHIHKYNYKIQFFKSSDYYKPGLKYTSHVKVSRHDGLPLDPNEEIIARHGFSTIDEMPTERRYRLDKNDVVKLEYLPPINVTNITALRIEVQYYDMKEKISPILAAVSHSNEFLQATLETDRVLVNLEVEVSVVCSEPMDYINYVIFGRGDVLLSKTLPVKQTKNTAIKFRALHAMVPVAHLIISYIRKNGEMIGDTLDIKVDGLLRNFLEIKSAATESEPGFDIDVQMKAQPYSFIGLMAIDEKNYLFAKGNDISSSLVTNDLYEYDNAKMSNLLEDGKLHFSWKPGGSNIYSGIQDSGGDILTDAHILRKKPTLNDIYLRPTIYGSSTVKPDTGFGLPIDSVTRPPLAGPYAFSRIPVPVWNIPKLYLKENIEDTWIFSNFSARYDGIISTRKKLPSSSANWIMTGFSLDPVYGLGIMNSKLYRTSRSFYIKLDLPYSVQRGEVVNIPVHVYNKMEMGVDVEVTLHNIDKSFRFVTISNGLTVPKNMESFQKKQTFVEKNSNRTVWFLIEPIKLGNIKIKSTASNPSTQDAISDYLLVKAEGETEYYSKAVLLDLRKEEYVKKRINFTIPKNMIPGSEKIEVACIGNIFGQILHNLDSVTRRPTGCGEQNLLYMMTSSIILKYLKTAKQNMPPVHSKALEYLEESYQTQLTFKKKDNAFGIFGKRDKESSVWLTAYTMMAFRQASEYIYIDESVVEKGYQWLSDMQGRNGSFYETGNQIHFDMQNKTGNSLPLTSFVIISFLENQKYTSKYKNTINKGLDYIARYIDESEDTYSIALCSYVLQLSRHPSKQSSFNLLDNRANYKDNMKWWAKPTTGKSNPWNELPRSIDIEMTSYALLTFLENNLLEDSIPIVNWVLKQQNSMGSFESTQDTVMCLQGLYNLMRKLSVPTNIQVEFSYSETDRRKFFISQNDVNIEQKVEIAKSSREVNVTAKGTGIAFLKVYYQYNKDVTGPWPMFILDPQVDKNSNSDHLQLSICIRFAQDQNNINKNNTSNMAVMEINLPSGYTVDIHSLPSLQVSQHVQKVEATNRYTKVNLYFNNIYSAIDYCPTISAFRTHKIAHQKSASIVIYDYYDTSKKARIFYHAPTTTACDICTEIDCESACVIAPKPQIREEESKQKSGTKHNSYTFVLLWMTLVVLIRNF